MGIVRPLKKGMSAVSGATAGLSSSVVPGVFDLHCWTSQQWHPLSTGSWRLFPFPDGDRIVIRRLCTLSLLVCVAGVFVGTLAAAAELEPWSYADWKPGGQRTTLDGITFDSTVHCGGGHNFVRVGPDHYRFRARIDHAPYAWRFYFRIECPDAVGRTITLEVADFNHAGRTVWHEGATVYSTDDQDWRSLPPENIEIVPWTPTAGEGSDADYGDRSHVPYGVRYRLRLAKPVMWFAVPTPCTLQRSKRLLDRLAEAHPKLVDVKTIGHSYHSESHGYPLRMARITAPGTSARKNVAIIAGEHSAESAGLYACEGWILEVLKHPDWLEEFAFHFVPVVNVDGIYYGTSYYGMAPELAQGIGQNISSNWAKRTLPEIKMLWSLLGELRPVFFASLHNGRHRRSMEALGPAGPGTDALVAAWRREVGFEFDGVRSHGAADRAWGILNQAGVTQLAYTIETVLLCRQEGFDTFQASYVETGRQLARGTVAGLRELGPRAEAPNVVSMKLKASPNSAAKTKESSTEQVDRLYFNGDDFTAQLPWFYHDMPFDEFREHDIHSFEVNGINLRSGDYTVALIPCDRSETLSVSFDGRSFEQMPVKDGVVELTGVGIHNRMLSIYVKAVDERTKAPLESVWAYPPEVTLAEAKDSAKTFDAYRRNIRLGDREILQKDNWDEFHEVLNRPGFGKPQLRAMFDDIVGWCKRRQVLDPDDIHYGAIYSEEDKYDFRDAAAAAVCFTHAWKDTGDDEYRRRAVLARDYCYKGQHMDDPSNRARFGGFCHMIHGAWGPGMQRLGGELGSTVGVETGIIANLLVKLIELGLEPSAKDVEHLRAAGVWMINNECSPGTFRHHEGASHDCQNSNALGAEAIVRVYYALKKLGHEPPEEWLTAARRGVVHYVEGQEAIGCWPYVFAKIGRGQAFCEHNIPDQGMGAYHFLVACDTAAFGELPGADDAMRRAARWWLSMSRFDRSGPMVTIDLDDREARGTLKFSRFTWCRFMAAASLIRIAEATGEEEPWRQLALCYMEHVDTKLRNRTDLERAPFRRATSEEMTLCSWIQAVEWAGVLLREMEERLP